MQAESRDRRSATGTKLGWWQVGALGVVLVALSLVQGAAAPATAGRRGAPADPSVSASVLLVGDSIMRSVVGPVQSAMVDRSAGRSATFNASGGLGVDDSPYVASRITTATVRTGGFSVIVVNLGANDTLAGYVTLNPAAHMRRILDAAGATPVLWVNQAETLPNHDVAAVAYNEALRTTATQYPTMTVVDWGAVLDLHHEYLDPDQLHLNPQGQDALAQVIVSAVDQELGG